MLKNSARNCTLKFSEILLIGLFLNTEKSRFDVPGPVKRLRPALPRRLKHWSELGSTGPPKLGGAGSQLAAQNAALGAAGTEKHSVLMYLKGFPGLVSVAQPGPVSRSGNAQGSLLLRPCGSPSVPQVAVKGTPSLPLS